MPSLLDDATTNGQMLLTYWGNDLALGFRGDPDFIRRCYNWTLNRDVAKGDLHWPFDKTGRLAYVLVENREAIVRGLTEQFRDEIVMSHEIGWIAESGWTTVAAADGESDEVWSDGTVDEAAVDKLAARKAEAFFAEHVTQEPFLLKMPTSLAPVYEIAGSLGGGGDDE